MNAAVAETRLEVPQGVFELRRHPHRADRPLRAWDAADEYVLHHLAEQSSTDVVSVLVNDGFGALSVGLHGLAPLIVNESAAGRMGTATNHAANQLSDPEARMVSIVDHLPERIDLLVIKLPKSLGQLEDQLHRLRPSLHPETVVVGAAMAKDVHTSTLDLFESIVGPTTTSLARKKARLIHATVDVDLEPEPNPWPSRWRHDGLELVNHGGVFSSRGIDRGTRFLLESLPDAAALDPKTIIDLGCGNGIVGLDLARRFPDAILEFCDESFVAIASAFDSVEANGVMDRSRFRVAPRLASSFDEASADLIVVNPPFHVDRNRGDDTAWEMFVDSHRVLRPGGRLVVVGNQHLGHHAKMNKIFRNCNAIAANPKFVVLAAHREGAPQA
ncbi:MAG: methyltransferase [Acidimicrobiales bacterium]